MATGHWPRTALRPDTRLCVYSRRLHEPALPLPPHGLPAPSPTGASQFLLCFHNLPGVLGATSPSFVVRPFTGAFITVSMSCVSFKGRLSPLGQLTPLQLGCVHTRASAAHICRADTSAFQGKASFLPYDQHLRPSWGQGNDAAPRVCVLRTGVLRCPAPGLPRHCGALWATAAFSQNSSRYICFPSQLTRFRSSYHVPHAGGGGG